MYSRISRRAALASLTSVALAPLVIARTAAQTQAKPSVVVYKDPNCGCCHNWVEHMKANGFVVTTKDSADVNSVKRAHSVAQPLWSCHTALIGSYVIEGHVPAADVKRFLAQPPKGVIGLAIPGMPASAPGMDVKPFQPYTVLAFDANGKTTAFAEHKQN
jgi:hypothetical protein